MNRDKLTDPTYAIFLFFIIKFADNGIQRMARNFDPAELERDVDESVTRNGPKLVLLVEYGTRNAAIDVIRDISWNLGESVTSVEDSNKLTIRR